MEAKGAFPAKGLVKFSPPQPEQILPRPRLFDTLDGRTTIVWVSAPAGSGKTSLAASWLATRGRCAAWYRLDAGDGDPASFFSSLTLALAARDEGLAAAVLPALTPEFGLGLTVFARNYMRRVLQSAARLDALVLDDYHELPGGIPLHAMLAQALDELPEGFRVIVTSRTPPPAEFARLRLAGRLTVLEWDALRLTEDECRDLVQARAACHLDVPSLLARTRGWVTGLILALEAERGEAAYLQGDPSLLFDYFVSEILATLDEPRRTVLLSTAWLPGLRGEDAVRLSGVAEAGRLLDEFVRRNLFTSRRAEGGVAWFEYHPLFRDFLQHSALASLPSTRVDELRRKSVDCLLDQGRGEAAIPALLALGDWEEAVRQLLRAAPGMLAQGRGAVLQAWLADLPAARREAVPWLSYYFGACLLPLDQSAARRAYARAFACFDAERDARGAYMAWIGAAGSFVISFDGVDEADEWISRLPVLRERYPQFPGVEIEAGVLSLSLSLTTLRQPDSPALDDSAMRLESLIPAIRDPLARVTACTNLWMYRIWVQGNAPAAEQLASEYQGKHELWVVTPLSHLLWKSWRAVHAWLIGDMEACEQEAQEAIEVGASSGVLLMDLYLRLILVFVAAYRGQWDQIRAQLDGLAPRLASARAFDAYQFHLVKLMTMVAVGDHAGTIEAARQLSRAAARTGILPARLYGRLGEVNAEWARGDSGRTRQALARVLAEAPGMAAAIGHWDALFLSVVFAEEEGDDEALSAADAAFFQFGAAHGLRNCYGITWRRDRLARMVVRALERNLVPDYVRALIRRHRLQPAEPPWHLADWPWRLRVRTLGGFDVLLDGAPLTFSASRTPVKPLELLKALIAAGGRDVSQDALADALWPEADGDAARRAFYTNLHRLRGLVGEVALHISEGRVSLNPAVCWTDLAAVGAIVRRIKVLHDGESALMARLSDELLGLGRGVFLPSDSFPWLAAERVRVAREVLSALELVRAYWQRMGDADRAGRCEQVMHALRA